MSAYLSKGSVIGGAAGRQYTGSTVFGACTQYTNNIEWVKKERREKKK